MIKLKKLSKKSKLGLVLFVIALALAVMVIRLHGYNFAVLNPKGQIAGKERSLMLLAVVLSAVVIIPVFAMTAFIAWKYRASNLSAKYTPDWDHNLAAETAWWLIPLTIITILSVVTWQSTHALDPFKPLKGQRPLTIQVVALQWKWLFIYPEQNVASVNFLDIPVNVPLSFQITSDAPMNSFWIPQLSGQMYAMSGMSTSLNMEATQTGTFIGRSANISGEGFAGMNFRVKADSNAGFSTWLDEVRSNSPKLDLASYNLLAEASENNPVTYFNSAPRGLYNYVVMKFMDPAYQPNSSAVSYGHSHESGK